MMKECMIEEVRVQAGLGSAPFYTNQSESLNFRLKSSVTSFKEMGLLAFVQAMENFSKAENQEVQLAYCCASKKMTVREVFKVFFNVAITSACPPIAEVSSFVQLVNTQWNSSIH